eukprot:scaffold57253_cov32-Tisochrysis_lutea.AAC.1
MTAATQNIEYCPQSRLALARCSVHMLVRTDASINGAAVAARETPSAVALRAAMTAISATCVCTPTAASGPMRFKRTAAERTSRVAMYASASAEASGVRPSSAHNAPSVVAPCGWTLTFSRCRSASRSDSSCSHASPTRMRARPCSTDARWAGEFPNNCALSRAFSRPQARMPSGNCSPTDDGPPKGVAPQPKTAQDEAA